MNGPDIREIAHSKEIDCTCGSDCFLFCFEQYLIKVNEIKTKKGVDLLQNLIKYYHAQCK